MTEPKLYGIERTDGTVSQEYEDIGLRDERYERVVEIVAVQKEHLAALEAVVRAADRMKHYVSHLPGCNESLLIGPCDCRLVDAMNTYDSVRAALGEIPAVERGEVKVEEVK